ncbi:hypothetical protein V1477_008413 [Vespula maculifrons]|uniref:Uncharacterized protein n=1 Tax=Vespula maculifrons TaxID=7453 RepID=A0ABD2CDA5_VESMC
MTDNVNAGIPLKFWAMSRMQLVTDSPSTGKSFTVIAKGSSTVQVLFRTPRCNQIPIKATPFVARNGIVVTLLSATRTHYNSLCCSRSVNHSKMPNATPGRCNVAAIFYYKDNLIHIVSEIPYKFCRDPVTLRVKSLLYKIADDFKKMKNLVTKLSWKLLPGMDLRITCLDSKSPMYREPIEPNSIWWKTFFCKKKIRSSALHFHRQFLVPYEENVFLGNERWSLKRRSSHHIAMATDVDVVHPGAHLFVISSRRLAETKDERHEGTKQKAIRSAANEQTVGDYYELVRKSRNVLDYFSVSRR